MNRRLTIRWALALTAMLLLALGPAFRAQAQNLALGKPAFASWNNPVAGNGGQDVTMNVTDNNFGTEWTDAALNGGQKSPSAPMDTVGVDLGTVQSIRYLRVTWGAARATKFTVEVADDVDLDPNSFAYGEPITSAWTTVYTRDETDPDKANWVNPVTNVNNDVIDLWKDTGATSLSHRVVRLNIGASSDTTNLTTNVVELQVYATALPAVSGVAKTAASAPIGDTVVQLIGPAAVAGGKATYTETVKTGADGKFLIPNVFPGDYILLGLPMGKYAVVQTNISVADGPGTVQDLTFTQAVQNTAANTAPLPTYTADNIAAAGETNGGNLTSGGLALPVDELPLQPTGDAIWTTGDPNAFRAPAAGESFGQGPKVPAGLHFYLPPYASGKNNVITGQNAMIPLPAAHYSALYILQSGADGTFDLPATLTYGDGTVQPVLTSSGSSTYRFTDAPGAPSVDEFEAVLMDKRYATSDGSSHPEGNQYRIFLRWIICDTTKVLKSVNFGTGFTSNGTTAKAVIYGWSGDTVDVPGAVGSVSGIVKAPASLGGGPVKNASVTILGDYRIVTDATGAYAYRGLPVGAYDITASKPANYPQTTVNVTVPAGSITQDIQFPYPIPVITDPLTNPNLDEISSDDPAATDTDPAKTGDFAATDFGLGSEYMPKGRWNPTTGNPAADPEKHNGLNIPNWEAAAGAPEALTFDFGDPTIDSPVAPGQAGYPIGGTPNTVCIHDFMLLAPQTKVLNAYLAITGLDGAINMTATLNYADGTKEVKKVNVSDWYGAPSVNELPFIVMHGRHTVATGRTPHWEDGVGSDGVSPHPGAATAANIFIKALVIPCDGTKILHDITFDHGDRDRLWPIVSAVSWETATPNDPSSDLRITVKKNDGSPAAGAWVISGPYSTKAGTDGVAIFKGVAAGKTVDLGAFLYGQTKQARVQGHVVPAGQKLPTPDDIAITLPAETPQFVQLPLNYDYDMISMKDMPGDFKGAANNDRAFNGDLMPASNTIVQDARTYGIPFLMPYKETYYSNVQRLNGQTWSVVPGNYSCLSFMVTGQGVGTSYAIYNHFTLNYDDGTSEQVQVANLDWVANYTGANNINKRYFYRELMPAPAPDLTTIGFNIRSRRHGGDDEQRADNSTTAFIQELVPINAAKTLKSITLPYMFSGIGTNDFSILAVTLEANSVTPEGSITGSVVGQPAGATASGPIAMAKAILDGSHMVYTDAGGNFTMPHVAPGTYQMQIVPVGQGIVSKSFPVTVTAGQTSNMGTLDVGASVRYIYAVLGASNSGVGLKQVEGAYNGYSSDSGRPNNKVNVTDSMTSPITIGGKIARQNRIDNVSTPNDYFYFQVDPGWLYHGRMGDPGTLPSADGATPGRAATGLGMDLSTFLPGSTNILNWKLGPKIYMFIEYYDNAKAGQTNDTIGVNYNRQEGWIHNTAATSWVTPDSSTGAATSIRMTDTYRTPQIVNPTDATKTIDWMITKGNTGTWKTASFTFFDIANNNTYSDPNNRQVDTFGAYAGQNLSADFRINPRYNTGDNPDCIRAVILSLDPTPPVLPAQPSAKDALRFAAGLATATTADKALDDVTGTDNKITVLDAIALAKQGLQ